MNIGIYAGRENYFGYNPLAALILFFAKENPGHKFIFFTNKEDEITSSLENVSFQQISPRIKNKLSRNYWLSIKLPKLLAQHSITHFVGVPEFMPKSIFPEKICVLTISEMSKLIHSKNSGKKLADCLLVFSDNDLEKTFHNQIPGLKNNTRIIPYYLPETIESAEVDLPEENFFSVYLDEENKQYATLILKAFSIFKKRMKSGMKMILLVDHLTKQDAIPALNTYKYRDSIELVKSKNISKVQKYLSQSLAFIIAKNTGASFMVKLAQQAGTVIVIVTDEPKENDLILSSKPNEKELAEQMMLVYKDEALAKNLKMKAANAIAKQQDELKQIDLTSLLGTGAIDLSVL